MSRKSYEKIVKFEFYQLYDDDRKADIRGIIDKAYAESSLSRIKKINGKLIKLDEVKKESIKNENDVYCIHFTKLRDDVLGYAHDDDDVIEDISMKEDQYIAEDISCLFDSSNCVLMIQRNKNSLSVSNVLKYINFMNERFCNADKSNIEPRIVIDKDTYDEVSNVDSYRSFDVKIAKSNFQKPEGKIGEIFSNLFEEYGCENIKIQVSVGRSPKKSLYKTPIRKLMENKDAFNKFNVKGKTDYGSVEVYDLIEGKLYSSRKYILDVDNNGRRHRLDEKKVFDDILQEYKSNLRDKVNKNINY